jgi:cytochrome c-type biogenesis protein
MLNIPIIGAFVGGIVSFLSPCVMPIIPGFLAYLGGDTSSNTGKPSRLAIFLNSFFFVLGFSLVFAALGVLLNTVLAHFASAVQEWLAWVGGAIVIFFGVYLLGFFHIGFLEYDHKIGMSLKFRSRYLTSLLFGFAFAAGWTPCVGPVLGAIFGLATSVPGAAFSLLLAYAIGLGLPFLLVGVFVAQSSELIGRIVTKLKFIEPTFGVILIVLGILVFTQNLPLIANLDVLNKLLLGK